MRKVSEIKLQGSRKEIECQVSVKDGLFLLLGIEFLMILKLKTDNSLYKGDNFKILFIKLKVRFAWEVPRKLFILIWIRGFFAGVSHSRKSFEQVHVEANSQAVLLGKICSWHFVSYNQKQKGVKSCLDGLVEALYLSWSTVCFSRAKIWSRLGIRMLFHPVQVGLLSDSTLKEQNSLLNK